MVKSVKFPLYGHYSTFQLACCDLHTASNMNRGFRCPLMQLRTVLDVQNNFRSQLRVSPSLEVQKDYILFPCKNYLVNCNTNVMFPDGLFVNNISIKP